MVDDYEDELDVGYGKPPVSTRFRKGTSGNPRGRPRGRHRDLPYESVLGQMVTIREDGVERRVTAEQAFLLHLVKRGLEGRNTPTIAAAVEKARPRIEDVYHEHRIVVRYVEPGSVTTALEILRMARMVDRRRPTARLALERWIVEAALSRLDGRRLTVEEQSIVVDTTRIPGKVKWPDWWQVKP